MQYKVCAIAALAVSGCAGDLLGPNQVNMWAYQKTLEMNEDGRRAGEMARQRTKELLAKGAMDPLDRAEVEIYRTYMDAKYLRGEAGEEAAEITSPKRR